MGAMPAMVFTLLARPLPAKARRPAASCTSTQESAEKLNRRLARPAPAVAASDSCCAGFDAAAACGNAAGDVAEDIDVVDVDDDAAAAPTPVSVPAASAEPSAAVPSAAAAPPELVVFGFAAIGPPAAGAARC